MLSRRSKHCIRKECRDKPCSTTVFFAGWWVLHPGFRFLKVLSLETTYRASTPVSSPEQCSTWPCATPRQRLFRLFCKQAVQHYCPKMCQPAVHCAISCAIVCLNQVLHCTTCPPQILKVLAEFARKGLPARTAAALAISVCSCERSSIYTDEATGCSALFKLLDTVAGRSALSELLQAVKGNKRCMAA